MERRDPHGLGSACNRTHVEAGRDCQRRQEENNEIEPDFFILEVMPGRALLEGEKMQAEIDARNDHEEDGHGLDQGRVKISNGSIVG